MFRNFYLSCFAFLSLLLILDRQASAEIPITTDKRIKTYVYHASDVYLITISPGFQTSIEFGQGEQIQTISLGDTF